MTSRLKWIIILPVLVAGSFYLGYKALFFFDKKAEAQQVEEHLSIKRFSPADYAALQDGDIILRRGFGFVSNYISKHFNKGAFDITHSGILHYRDNRWQVIHTLSSDVSDKDGVQKQGLDTFLAYSHPYSLIVVRHKTASLEKRKEVAQEAYRYTRRNHPFDRSGNYEDTTELFCSEFIWHLYGQDSTWPDKADEDAYHAMYYDMATFYDTTRFTWIINQYLEKPSTTKP